MKEKHDIISEEDENRVKLFIESTGLKAEKKERENRKVHDYDITDSDGFYCLGEVKTLYYENGSDEPRSFKNIERKLLGKIREACEQFDTSNSSHFVPNILFFCSNDFRVHQIRLIEYFKSLKEKQKVYPTKHGIQKIFYRMQKIDLFVWILSNNESHYLLNGSHYMDKLIRKFHIPEDSIKFM